MKTNNLDHWTGGIPLADQFQHLKAELSQVTAQRDELLAVIHKIERRTRGADGSNQHPSGALRSIGAIARTAISKAEQH